MSFKLYLNKEQFHLDFYFAQLSLQEQDFIYIFYILYFTQLSFQEQDIFFIFCILYCAQLFCQEQDIYFIFYILHNYFCPEQDIHFIFCTIIFAGAGYIFYIFYFIFHIIFYILQNNFCRSRIYPELVFLGQSKELPPHLRFSL